MIMETKFVADSLLSPELSLLVLGNYDPSFNPK